jgi:HAD superfamily hydrolase (TIGR01549 family)
MSLQDIGWLFFDLGNTLIDESKPEEVRIKSIQDSCKDIGLDLTTEYIRKQIEKASAGYASSIIKEAVRSIVNSEDDYLYVMNGVKYLKELEEPYYDTAEILERLHGLYSIGIIANQSFGTEKRLRNHGLLGFIDLCLSSAEIGIEKPDPEIFLMALEKAECKPENAVMIGDRLDNDIYPAKKMGFKTVHILRGFGRVQIPKSEEYKADYTIKELKELGKILKGD